MRFFLTIFFSVLCSCKPKYKLSEEQIASLTIPMIRDTLRNKKRISNKTKKELYHRWFFLNNEIQTKEQTNEVDDSTYKLMESCRDKWEYSVLNKEINNLKVILFEQSFSYDLVNFPAFLIVEDEYKRKLGIVDSSFKGEIKRGSLIKIEPLKVNPSNINNLLKPSFSFVIVTTGKRI